MRKIFVEKSYTKCAGETIPRPFSKKSKFSIYLYQLCKVLNSVFFFCILIGGLSKYSEIKLQTADYWLSTNTKLFKKTENGLELVPLPHFLHNF